MDAYVDRKTETLRTNMMVFNPGYATAVVGYHGILSCARSLFKKTHYVNDEAELVGVFDGATLILPDHPGHGNTDTFTLEGAYNTVDAVTEMALKCFDNVVVAGFSMSCNPVVVNLSDRIKADRPHQDATILVSPPNDLFSYLGYELQTGALAAKYLPDRLGHVKNFIYGIIDKRTREIFNNSENDPTRMGNLDIDGKIGRILPELLKFPVLSDFIKRYVHFGNHPLYMISGEDDRIVPQEDMEEVANALRNACKASYKVVKKGSHHITLEGDPRDTNNFYDPRPSHERIDELRELFRDFMHSSGIWESKPEPAQTPERGLAQMISMYGGIPQDVAIRASGGRNPRYFRFSRPPVIEKSDDRYELTFGEGPKAKKVRTREAEVFSRVVDTVSCLPGEPIKTRNLSVYSRPAGLPEAESDILSPEGMLRLLGRLYLSEDNHLGPHSVDYLPVSILQFRD